MMPDLAVSEDREAREFFGKAMASMSHELAKGRVSVAADPYALLLSLFLALECLYEGCTGGQEIEIEVADAPARIELRGAAGPLDAAAGDQRVAAIASLVARHGGQLKRSESGGAEVLTLVP